jgi:hypothetical protein
MPPVVPSGRPAASASAVFGRTPSPSTTMSAGTVPASVTTALTRPSFCSKPVTEVPVRMSTPMPDSASATIAPMSGSTVDIGCAACSIRVTESPRLIIASAISTPM